MAHKHTEEIRFWSGLKESPLFVPSVGNFARGLLLQIPLMEEILDPQEVRATLRSFYATSERITVMEERPNWFPDKLSATALAKTDEIRNYLSLESAGGFCWWR